jgi:TRAP-type C4-dicarboxylate transport system permease small subunit
MKAIYVITKYMGYVGAFFIAAMMVLTTADVFLRYVFNRPIAGTAELCAIMLVMVVSAALGWTALEHAHVKVDLLMEHLPKKVQFVVDGIMLVLSLGIFAIMTVWTTGEMFAEAQTSSILRVSMIPFQWIFWAGLLVFCICIIVLIIEHIKKGLKG